jgi:hypothetical protein
MLYSVNNQQTCMAGLAHWAETRTSAKEEFRVRIKGAAKPRTDVYEEVLGASVGETCSLVDDTVNGCDFTAGPAPAPFEHNAIFVF